MSICDGNYGDDEEAAKKAALSVLATASPLAEKIEELRNRPQAEMPVTHRFQEGVYIREIFMPADAQVVGHVHKSRHWNIVVSGKALVSVSGGKVKAIEAGDVFVSEAGSQKWLLIAEDMRFITIHANPGNSEDIPAVEETIIDAPPELLAAKGTMTLDEFRLSVNHALEKAQQP